MSFDILPQFEETDDVKPSVNVGALMDIPTGTYQFGRYRESILNGGVGILTGIVGQGNNFKSTIQDYLTLTASSRFEFTRIDTYDTEVNVNKQRKTKLAQAIERYKDRNLLAEGIWKISDRTVYFANKWYEKFKEFAQEKIKQKVKFTRETPFLELDGTTLMKWLIPTFTQIDSFSEFETEDIVNIQDENELGDSGGNTIHMRQGLAKIRFLSDVLRYISRAANPMFLTAHVGKDIPMDARAGPVKKLTFLKGGDKIKGVTDKFMFLTSLCLHSQNGTVFFNDTTKGPEYPRDSDDKVKGDTDLFTVTVIILRNKNGPTGLVMTLLVSQREGVLGPLTEFHYVKTNNRYGIGGNLQHYFMDLLPDVSLSRTSVRSKLVENAQLRRAVNITSEMCQMFHLWDREDDLYCSPKQLREDLESMGYDWNILLNTRGWWTLDNDKQEVPFLSTLDLLRMRKGLYHPYWLAEDKRTILTYAEIKKKFH
jgi:hypothetical protein